MSESIVARSNPFGGAFNKNNEQANFEPARSDNSQLRISNNAQNHQLNLRDALEWLLGSHPHHEEEPLSHEDKTARKNRRMELLMWILNLEPRLAPYGDY